MTLYSEIFSNFKNKIGFKIALLSWVILVSTLIVFLTINLQSSKKIVLERLESEASNIAASIIESNSYSLITEEYSYVVEHCVNLIKTGQSLDYIAIVKRDGFSLIHHKDGWLTDSLGGFWTPNENISGGQITSVDLVKDEVYHYSKIFEHSGINWGWVHVGLNLNDYNQSLSDYYNRTFIISIALIILGLIISFLFARQFTKPIRLLENTAKKIATGDLDVKVDIKTNDEIESLANSFNVMTSAVKKSNDLLEEKVAQRTSELDVINNSLRKEINVRKEMEDDLRQAKLLAEQSEKVKSDFLAQMSHEIRTPINTILSFSSLLKAEFKDKIENEDLLDSFEIIENGSNRLIRTIDLILNMSALQAGTYTAQPEMINISKKIIEPLLGEMKILAESSGLILSFENKASNSTVLIDHYSVTQILANLIHNSIKYTNEGTVIVKTEDQGEDLIVSVIDTGIGIDEKYLPHLFNAFTQEENGYSRKFEGTGLGMALVKEYCKINGASIEVLSKKGVGSTFQIKFTKNGKHISS